MGVLRGEFEAGFEDSSCSSFIHVSKSGREGRGRDVVNNVPPYKLSCSSLNMSMTSHSKTLLPTNPQLIPGMSLSVCICLNWRVRMMEALDCDPPAGEAMLSDVLVLSRLCKSLA